MRTGFSVPREDVVLLLDSGSMTEESYDILDSLEEAGCIDKLTAEQVNTFIFYYAKGMLRVALSNLNYATYRERLAMPSPYIRL